MSIVPFKVSFWEKQAHESDRALAIIGAAILDEELANLLEAFLVDDKKVAQELLSTSGPLGAFGARAKLVYALGLIDEPTFRDLKLVQKIRNRLAHVSSNIDFTDQKLSSFATALEIPRLVGNPEYPDPDAPRGQFFGAVAGILWNLATERLRLQREGGRRKPEPIYPLGDRAGIEFETAEQDSGGAP